MITFGALLGSFNSFLMIVANASAWLIFCKYSESSTKRLFPYAARELVSLALNFTARVIYSRPFKIISVTYPIYIGGVVDLVSNTDKQQQVIFPVNTVVRMASATNQTKVTMRARRLINIAGTWWTTEAETFYEFWAVSNTGADLFQATSVVWSGEWVTATFAPSVGTVIGGIKVKTILSTEYDFSLGYTFTFGSGPQGWTCAPQDLATYPVGSPYGPASYRTPYAGLYWSWSGRLGVNCDPQELIGFDVHNLWCFFPPMPVYGQAGAFIQGDIIHGGNAWIGFGTLYTDGTWEYSGTIETATLTKACAAGNYGKQVRCWQFDVNSMWNKWQYLDNVLIQGWDLDPTNAFMMSIYEAYISNVCAV